MQSTDRQTQKWPGANRQTADRQTSGRQTPDRPGTDRRTTGRYSLVDGIRGLAVVNMIAFHFLFDWFEIFHGDYSWYWMTPVRIWQQFICWTFILVSGFVWTWGNQKNLQRGLFLNFCGCMISIVMLLFLPEQAIWFGILNFYGCAVLLTIPLEKLLCRIPPEAGLAAAFVLFLLTQDLQLGYLGAAGVHLAEVPRVLYTWKPMTILGFPYPGFRSSDYYPMLPWYFLFLCGYFLQMLFERHPKAQRAAHRFVPFLTPVGRKSIWIYLLHQPVCYAAAAFLSRFI